MLFNSKVVAIGAQNVNEGVLTNYCASVAPPTIAGEGTWGESGGLLWVGSLNQMIRQVFLNSEGCDGGLRENLTG